MMSSSRTRQPELAVRDQQKQPGIHPELLIRFQKLTHFRVKREKTIFILCGNAFWQVAWSIVYSSVAFDDTIAVVIARYFYRRHGILLQTFFDEFRTDPFVYHSNTDFFLLKGSESQSGCRAGLPPSFDWLGRFGWKQAGIRYHAPHDGNTAR